MMLATRRRRLALALLVLVVGGGLLAAVMLRGGNPDVEAATLADLLDLQSGMTVAEIGAGKGAWTVRVAERLGPRGRMYSTEVDTSKLAGVEQAAREAGLENVTVLLGGNRETNLPAECCDAVFMVKVYHHFTEPAAMNASLYQALRPGGRLAVIDFAPSAWKFWLLRPDGVPEGRGGHGMPQQLLADEITAARFQLERIVDSWGTWPGWLYCAVFRKPEAE